MPQAPNVTVQLVHIQGPLKGQIQDFSQFPVFIGRHSSCQVRFDKDLTTISRRHARINRQGNRFRIIDASTNGTYVNGKRIADVYLRDGDVISFAENGPKASFLTKIEAGDATVPRARSAKQAQPVQLSPVSPGHPKMPSPPPVKSPAVPSTPPPHTPEPSLTAGPGMELPVISADAPLIIQLGPTLQSFNLLPVTIGTDPACDFVITGNDLAGRHLQIFFSENEYYAKDLTGQSMVSINGRPVGTQSVIAQGAELSLTDRGPKFRFLGGSRLAEIQDVVSEPLEKTDAESNLVESDSETSVPKNKSKPPFKNTLS
jgi:pSer/pThr/pTyr-binding forkhead associated (FHA) protein